MAVVRDTGHERLDERRPRASRQLLGDPVQRLGVPLQLEVVVGAAPHRRERQPMVARVVRHVGGADPRVASHQIVGELCALDGGAGDAEAVGEVPDRARDPAPRTAHRSAGDAHRLAVRRFLVNHEVEGHDAGEEILEAPQRPLVGRRQRRRKADLQG
ncbi:MAG: hypothetical protein B7Z72_15155, partial [Gemmatimonadetes bacterium 21-71-4]